MNDLSAFMQWNFTSADGVPVLLAVHEKTGLMFAESAGRFITIIIEEVPDEDMLFHGLPPERAFWEHVCNYFRFSCP